MKEAVKTAVLAGISSWVTARVLNKKRHAAFVHYVQRQRRLTKETNQLLLEIEAILARTPRLQNTSAHIIAYVQYQLMLEARSRHALTEGLVGMLADIRDEFASREIKSRAT